MSKVIIGLCVFVLLVITPAVKADPIVITGGSLTVVGPFGIPTYTMTGQNFMITATGRDQGNTPNCFPCPSGTPISISSFLVGSTLGAGTVTINGTTFTNVFFFGQVSLAAPNVILPPDLASVTVTAPFVLSGFMFGCDDPVICSNQIFITELIGQGTVTALFDSPVPFNGITLYTFRRVIYTFETAEVPEPVTILLLSSGLIGMGVKLRERSKQG